MYMNLEDVTIREIIQAKANAMGRHFHVESKMMNHRRREHAVEARFGKAGE